jgi:hypothetical protein
MAGIVVGSREGLHGFWIDGCGWWSGEGRDLPRDMVQGAA